MEVIRKIVKQERYRVKRQSEKQKGPTKNDNERKVWFLKQYIDKVYVYLYMSNYVSVYLMGGLGNQLFQIFASLAFCLENEYELIMPYTDKLQTGHVRNTYWENFLQELKPFTNINEPITNEKLFAFPFLESKILDRPFPRLEDANTHYMILRLFSKL